MKKNREKEIQMMELLCIAVGLAICILGILFLMNVLQNYWFLNFVLGLAVLLHAALTILFFVRQRSVLTGISGVFLLFYAGTLIFLNFF